jgi:peptidoglycan-N-acetylglucosamine deacetylase
MYPDSGGVSPKHGVKTASHLVAAGHRIANHTFTHLLNLPRPTPPQIHTEINQASDAITAASGGHRPALFRAPAATGRPPF